MERRRFRAIHAAIIFSVCGGALLLEGDGDCEGESDVRVLAALQSPEIDGEDPISCSVRRGEGRCFEQRGICLGKYTSSMAAKKSGMLELFDAAI